MSNLSNNLANGFLEENSFDIPGHYQSGVATVGSKLEAHHRNILDNLKNVQKPEESKRNQTSATVNHVVGEKLSIAELQSPFENLSVPQVTVKPDLDSTDSEKSSVFEADTRKILEPETIINSFDDLETTEKTSRLGGVWNNIKQLSRVEDGRSILSGGRKNQKSVSGLNNVETLLNSHRFTK